MEPLLRTTFQQKLATEPSKHGNSKATQIKPLRKTTEMRNSTDEYFSYKKKRKTKSVKSTNDY